MKMIQLSQVILCGLLTLAMPASYAISVSSISDAISGNSFTSSHEQTTITTTTKTTTREASTSVKTENTENTPSGNHAIPNPALFVEDAAMTAYIHSQLLFKRDIPSVNVTTENAVVSLSGTVDTKEQAATLVKIASSVKGVKSVNTDHLIVRRKTA